MLLSPGYVITGRLANLIRELGALPQPEIEAIIGLLAPDTAAVVREMALASRKANDLPLTDAIGLTLDRWWETTARSKVEADLRIHAQQAAPR